jgi:hypothetical protein
MAIESSEGVCTMTHTAEPMTLAQGIANEPMWYVIDLCRARCDEIAMHLDALELERHAIYKFLEDYSYVR